MSVDKCPNRETIYLKFPIVFSLIVFPKSVDQQKKSIVVNVCPNDKTSEL